MRVLKVAYIQSIGGASGDMLLGALLDLGFSLDQLRHELAKLDIDGYELAAAQETRHEVRGTKLTVTLADRRRRSPRVLLDTVVNSSLPAEVKARATDVLSAL